MEKVKKQLYFAIGFFSILVISLLVLVKVIIQTEEILDIDPQSGNYMIVNPIGTIVVGESIRIKTIEDFIRNFRAVSPVEEENIECIKKVYEFTQGNAHEFINNYYVENNNSNSPLIRAGYVKVAVEIEDVHKLEGSDNEYSVTWHERTYGVETSKLLNEVKYSAYLTLEAYGMNTSDVYEYNSLHIFVTEIEMSNY